MKNSLISMIVCAVMVALAASSVSAYRSYTTATGKPCSYCHIDPGGGGPLTAAGQYYFDNGTLPPEAPSAPTGLAASATSQSQINLTWTDTSNTETAFKVERSASASGPFALIATLAAGATTYSNTGLSASTTYYYRVYASNIAGNSAYTNTASAATLAPPPVAPSAPTGLTASAISQSQINLTWTDTSSTETAFKVERSASASGPFALIATLAAGATTYSNTGLAASTTYYYRVCASNIAGNSAYTNTASAATLAPPPVAPSAPTGLAASAISQSQTNLTWTDTSSTETAFKVERSASASGPFALIATLAAGATTYSNTGLAASTTYYYRVCASNIAGNSAYSNTASAATLAPPPPPPGAPSAPTGLTSLAVSQSQINLTWTDTSSNESGFKLERSTSASGPFVQIAILAAGATAYSNTGLSASTIYYYRVRSFVAMVANSTYSNVASAATLAPPPPRAPSAPTSLAASAVSASQINLTWTDTSSNESGFKLERSTSASGPFAQIAILAAGATTYSNTGLIASTTYYYRVRSFIATVANSTYSNVASAATKAPPPAAPSAPSGLAASAVSQSEIGLTWADTSSNESGFKLERSTISGGPYALIATLPAGSISYSDTGLSASTTYYYRVRSFIAMVANSTYSNVASAATLAAPLAPIAPAGLAASAVVPYEINLEWTASTSPHGHVIRIERSSSESGPFSAVEVVALSSTSYTDSGLSAAEKYFYRICALNAAGDAAYSEVVSAKTLSTDDDDEHEDNEADHEID